MDKVDGGLEDETEDQILARALEESLRHYNEVEVPRLSQVTKKTEVTQEEEVEVWDGWEEWDGEQFENAVKVEESLIDEVNFKETNTVNNKKTVQNNQGSVEMMNKYLYREVVPRQTSISVGEVGNDGADGFDKEAGRLWIYPCNFPVRKYQLDIVHSALFDNTLVSLPTGLGKTFIAAVVMYNFYRWFPMGKIIFLAPTRPLVAQQIHACYEIMGIPKEDTLELTGSKHASERAKAWKEKRVFFATPQVAANDLATGACPGDLVRCVVVDEAHRAAGNHAICQAIRGLLRLREQSPGARFRVLALSATPGKNIPSVTNVVTTLQISKLELRDEQSPDVAPHTHQRNAETVVVPLGPELAETRNRFLMVMDPYLDRLMSKNLLYCGQKSKLNKFQARANFRINPPPRMDYSQKGLVEGDFAVCITLTHALGLLLTHGQRTFMSFIQGIIDGGRGNQVVRGRLVNNIPLLSLLSDLKERLGGAYSMLQPAPDVSLSEGMAGATEGENVNKPFITSHPKMDHLKEIVIEHFEKYQRNGQSTRVMVFCEYRDPVVEICNMLMRHWPLVKPMSFVGQASSSGPTDPNAPGTSKITKGFTQKQQLQAVRGFREGGYNVLVSTCVGEEGLDIGEVDLIVCYDAPHASPLRLIQRMGRTGRKREGRVVTLVTQDWEEQKHKMGLRQKNTIVKSLMTSKILANSLCQNNPRVLPPGTDPKCHMMPMVMPKDDEEEDKKAKKGKSKMGKTKDPSKIKKGKRKANTKAVGDACSDDEENERAEGIHDDEERDNNSGEAAPSVGKGKGKGKARKKSSKVSLFKKPVKGIQAFFKTHKAEVCQPVIEVEEEFDDDDFVGKGKQQTKAHNESNDVMIIDEDVTCLAQIPVDKGFRFECGVGSSKFTLPPDLIALENAVTSIFGDCCCPCSKSNSSFRCSVIASHFQLRHTITNPLPLDVESLDFLTAEVLLNFDAEEEAGKVESWKPDYFMHSPIVEEYLWESNFNLPAKENVDFCPSPKSNQNRPHSVKNTICLVETTKAITIDNREKNVTNKDAECKSVKSKSLLNSANSISSCPPSPPVENLLWNVFGKKSKKEIRSDVNAFDDDVSHKNEKIEECIPVSNESDLKNQMSTFKLFHINDIPEKTSPKKMIPTTIIKNSPSDTIEVKFAHGSRESTPDNLPLKQAFICKSSPHTSPIIGKRKQTFCMASSTPKVHRKNLFPASTCLASPITDNSKKSAEANFDLLPSDEEFSDHDVFSPPSIKCLLPEKQTSPNEIGTLSQPSSVNVIEQIENEIHNYEVPNFDLGWEDEFNSEAYDDITFVDLENFDEETDEPKTACIGEDKGKIISLDTKSTCRGEEIQKKDSKHFVVSPSVEEKSKDSSKGYIEKSSDLFSSVVKKTVPFSKVQGKLLRGDIGHNLNSQFGNLANQSYTVTQMVDMLASPEITSISCEKQKAESKGREVNDQQQLAKENEIDEFNPSIHIENDREPHKYSSCFEVNIVSSSPVKGAMFDNPKSKLGKEGHSKKVNKEAILEEINFDIGDENFLDVSADLFAEDDTEDWLRANGEVNKKLQSLPDKIETLSEKEVIPAESGVMLVSSKKDEKLYDGVENEELKKNSSHMEDGFCGDAGKTSGQEGRNIVQELKNVLPAIAIPGIAGWSADGWLSKSVPANRNKLSLCQKNSKREVKLDSRPKDSRSSLITDVGSIVTKVSSSVYVNKTAYNEKVDKGDNWIDEITSEKVASRSCRPIKSQRKKLSDLPSESSNLEGAVVINYEKLVNKYDKIYNDKELKSKEDALHDAPKTFDEQLSKKYSESNKKSEKKGEKNFMLPEPEEMNLNLKQKTVSSKSRDEVVSKPIEVFDVVTLSSDDSEKDAENCEDVKLPKKSPGDDESINKNLKEDGNDLNEDWSDWEGIEDNKHNNFEGSESSDDFESLGLKRIQKRTPAANSSKEISISSEEKPPVRLRHRARHRKRCEFLESQAEESFFETGVRKMSSDDDDDDKGNSQYYDPSFINDGLPHSQEGEVDIQAKYLQSVRSPRNAKFKIPHLPLLVSVKENKAASPEAYAPDPSESCYMNDSFCVDGEDEEIIYEENAEDTEDELEVLEAILSKKAKDKKSEKRKKKEYDSSEDEVEVVEIKRPQKKEKAKSEEKKRKRKRIIMHDSSDEDDRPCEPPMKKTSLGGESASGFGAGQGETSRCFDEHQAKEQKSKGPYPGSSKKKNRALYEDKKNGDVSEKYESSDSRAFTERRTCKLNLGKEQKNSEASREKLLANNHGLISSNVQKGGGSKDNNTSNEGLEKKAFPNLVDEIASNWSADLFDSWKFSDDEEPTGTETRNCASSVSNQFLDSLNKFVVSHKELEISRYQDKSNMITSLCKSGNSVEVPNHSHSKTISELPTDNYIKAKITPINTLSQLKANTPTDSSFSSYSLLDFKTQVGYNAKSSNQNVSHLDTKTQEVSASSDKPCVVTPHSSSHVLTSTSSAKMPSDMETLIIVSPVEACRATEVVSALRAISKVRVVVFSPGGTTSVPYALGKNMCLFRCSVSELGRGSKIADLLQAAHKLYSKTTVIVEWGEESSFSREQKNPWAQKSSSSVSTTLSPSACVALINFGLAHIRVLHSSGKAETAKLIAKVARHYQKLELELGVEPIILPKSFSITNSKLKFYASLPGVNPVQALRLLQQFPKISSFLSKCSSARTIQTSTGLDLNKALLLYKILSGVHISDT